jgi:hypothetical protein
MRAAALGIQWWGVNLAWVGGANSYCPPYIIFHSGNTGGKVTSLSESVEQVQKKNMFEGKKTTIRHKIYLILLLTSPQLYSTYLLFHLKKNVYFWQKIMLFKIFQQTYLRFCIESA